MLKEHIDYYINQDGNFVFTKEYHLKRGFCCKNKCLHCPWNYGRSSDKNTNPNQDDNTEKV
ncbi:MAG: hypothetical protein JWP94_3446 [Mucilaginibacter sp.]|nr:hypothetical protein [Mucilaginibacter sp.]